MRSIIHHIRQHRAYQILAVILLLAGINFACGIHWGVPTATSAETVSPWPVDTIAPVKPLAEAHHKFKRDLDSWIIYPLFHYIVVDIAYAPYLAALFLSGGIENPSGAFPYGVTNPEATFATLTIIARLVSLLMALGIIVTVFLITRQLFTESAALWAALCTALIAPLAFYAKTSNLDVPYLFWTMLAIWQCLLAIQSQQYRHYILFGVFGALAIASKDQAYGYFSLTPFIFAWAIARHNNNGRVNVKHYCFALVSKPIIITGIATVATFALANNLLFGGLEGYLKHLEFAQIIHEQNVRGQNAAIYTLGWQFTLLTDSVQMLVRMLGWGSLLLALAGIVYCIRKQNYTALVLPLLATGYYLSVTAPVGMVLSRYLLGIAILFMPFLGMLIHQVLQRKTDYTKQAALALVIASIIWQGLLSINLNYTLLNDSRVQMEAWIKDNIPTGTIIETYTQPRYLPRIADEYEYRLIANNRDAIDYELQFADITIEKLQQRNPEYILVLNNVGVTGDPAAQDHPLAQQYYRELLQGNYGYETVAHFNTPSFLPYKQITAGTEPDSILLRKVTANQ